MTDTADPSPRARLILAAVSCALVALPFLVVRYAPSTDIPQHVAQMRLFLEAASDPSGPYRVQWLTPYYAGYAVLGPLFALVDPVAAARLALMAAALLWAASAHGLAAWRGRPSASAVLASVCAFNLSLYFGFYSFLFGWPLFAVWLYATAPRRAPASSAGLVARAAAVFALGTLLFLTHALWFAAAALWAGVSLAIRRRDRGDAAALVAGTAAALALPAVWYLRFAGSQYAAAPTQWALLGRYADGMFTFNSAIGGLRGPVDAVILLAAVAWPLAGVWQNRRALAERSDGYLAAAGATFLLAAVVLPMRFQSTIVFGPRWLSVALVLLLLAAPAPRLGRRTALVACAVLAAYCAQTALMWRGFETAELSGLDDALAAVPERSRLMQLDFVDHSEFLTIFVVDYMNVYAQAQKGGTVNFSFASFPHSFVVFENPADASPPWGDRPDPRYFDYALVDATPAGHDRVREAGYLPVTEDGRWRLYRTPASGAPPPS